MGVPNIYELFYLFTMIKAVDPVTRGNPIQYQRAWNLDPSSVDLRLNEMTIREGVKHIYANLREGSEFTAWGPEVFRGGLVFSPIHRGSLVFHTPAGGPSFFYPPKGGLVFFATSFFPKKCLKHICSLF